MLGQVGHPGDLGVVAQPGDHLVDQQALLVDREVRRQPLLDRGDGARRGRPGRAGRPPSPRAPRRPAPPASRESDLAEVEVGVGDRGHRPAQQEPTRGRGEHRADRPAVALQRDARPTAHHAVQAGVGVADDDQADRVLEGALRRRLGQRPDRDPVAVDQVGEVLGRRVAVDGRRGSGDAREVGAVDRVDGSRAPGGSACVGLSQEPPTPAVRAWGHDRDSDARDRPALHRPRRRLRRRSSTPPAGSGTPPPPARDGPCATWSRTTIDTERDFLARQGLDVGDAPGPRRPGRRVARPRRHRRRRPGAATASPSASTTATSGARRSRPPWPTSTAGTSSSTAPTSPGPPARTGRSARRRPPSLHATADGWGDALYSEGVCSAAVPVPDDASTTDRLLARLGRDPGWRPAA